MSSVNAYPKSTKVFMYINEAMYELRDKGDSALVFEEFNGQWGKNYKVDGEPQVIKKWLQSIQPNKTISKRCRETIKKKIKELAPFIKED